MDRIGYPHVRVGSDTSFGSDTPKSISNPYPFKKIGFYPYPYPLSSQRIFLLFDRIGSGRKSTDTDTFAISTGNLVLRKVFENTTDPSAEKFQPNWEGPYIVTHASESGSYALEKLDGTPIPRMWNVMHLKRYYQ